MCYGCVFCHSTSLFLPSLTSYLTCELWYTGRISVAARSQITSCEFWFISDLLSDGTWSLSHLERKIVKEHLGAAFYTSLSLTIIYVDALFQRNCNTDNWKIYAKQFLWLLLYSAMDLQTSVNLHFSSKVWQQSLKLFRIHCFMCQCGFFLLMIWFLTMTFLPVYIGTYKLIVGVCL